MLAVAGWLIWALVAFSELATLREAFVPVKAPENARQWAFALQSGLGAIALLATSVLPLSKFHLLWMYPVVIMSPAVAARIWMSLYPLICPRRFRAEYGGGAAEQLRAELQGAYGEIWTLPEIKTSYALVGVVSPTEYEAGREQVERVISDAPIAQDEDLWNTPRGKLIIHELIPRRHEHVEGVGMVFVRRLADDVEGSFLFKERPQFYFSPSESLGGSYDKDDEPSDDEVWDSADAH